MFPEKPPDAKLAITVVCFVVLLCGWANMDTGQHGLLPLLIRESVFF